ncbi:MAG: sulfite exporter TauE/SafE family protein [Candidatus Levybacteria bacterium]|nr:sulfite exporter TauE/SafE family protein [Candidatus Levybacteria bacterium]
MKRTIIDIKGMHCGSCELLIEEEISKIQGVKRCFVSHRKGQAEIYHKIRIEQNQIRLAVEAAGYSLGKEKKYFFSHNIKDYKELCIAVISIFILFYLANALGLFNLGAKTGNNFNSLPVVLLIGLTAGISTCMAIVGGLVLGASARFAEKHPAATTMQKFKPHLFFNLGRIGSYFILGAIIGYAGSLFQLSSSMLGILTIFVGFVMLLLGIQLTEVIPGFNRFKITMPKQISKIFGIQQKSSKEYSHKNSAAMGALTFFLPCGFTQAMQLYSISSGSLVVGALTMGTFAVGTAPGLLGIGGLTSVVKGASARHFFKFAGVVVTLLAFFNISNGVNLTGFSFNLSSVDSSTIAQAKDPNVTVVNGTQIVKMTQSGSGYEPDTFTIQKGIPVKWVINSEDTNTCASSLVVPELGIRKGLAPGENTIDFTPNEIGTTKFSCIMGMYTGVFNVVKATEKSSDTSNIQSPLSNVNKAAPAAQSVSTQPSEDPNTQVLKATYSADKDIQPNNFTVIADKAVRLEIAAEDDGAGCMGSVMIPGLTREPKLFTKGQSTVFTFTPKKGEYNITCAMGIPRGKIIAKEGGD